MLPGDSAAGGIESLITSNKAKTHHKRVQAEHQKDVQAAVHLFQDQMGEL
jgi:hypothetical protein